MCSPTMKTDDVSLTWWWWLLLLLWLLALVHHHQVHRLFYSFSWRPSSIKNVSGQSFFVCRRIPSQWIIIGAYKSERDSGNIASRDHLIVAIKIILYYIVFIVIIVIVRRLIVSSRARFVVCTTGRRPNAIDFIWDETCHARVYRLRLTKKRSYSVSFDIRMNPQTQS